MWNVVVLLFSFVIVIALSTLLTKHTVNVAIRQSWRPITIAFSAYLVGVVAGILIALIFLF